MFALEVQKLYKQIPLLDSTLVLSIETARVVEDYLTAYALTSGKSSVGVVNFKANVLALVDKSKMLVVQSADNTVAEQLNLNQAYTYHSTLHDKVHLLKLQLVSELNVDLASIFSEKKYKELLNFAK